jgi:iron complex transport system permease protein
MTCTSSASGRGPARPCATSPVFCGPAPARAPGVPRATRLPALAAALPRARRRGAALAALATGLAVALVASCGIGAVAIGPGQVLAILGEQVGLALPWTFEPQQASILLTIRLPRVALGVLVGAALAVAGAGLQGLFRNPLADPTLVGVSSGASLAAVAVIVLAPRLLPAGWGGAPPYLAPVAAVGGGLLVTGLVYRIARAGHRTLEATLLLAGIALNALAFAGVGLLIFLATDEQLRSIMFWNLGSLGAATWQTLAVAGPLIAVAVAGLVRLARPLDALLLGEAEAGHVGIEVDRVRRGLVVGTALAVGAAVAVTGTIGFVGLVAPHLLRLSIGADHRTVMPGAALLGASLVLAADLVARTLVRPAELPIGIVTALLGAPFFLWLLLRDRRRSAGI